ncbi:hypothetical protein FRB96_000408 [Tulasnella sp. 330]|nr:hypothetical protein FRB96_000408 [Tulasnella sp. 330]KAG8885353.1 hypothetical protein FRB97_001428 [Tulasnella sp. 331]KAG8890962.1 hypothetical protein FRB98_002982 [Tulasnella sp. 332]
MLSNSKPSPPSRIARAVHRTKQLQVHLKQPDPYSTNLSARKRRAAPQSPPISDHNLRPFNGYFVTTGHALCLVQAARNGLIPFRTARLGTNERPRSGSVYVFEAGSSGMKRWTDNMAWSPTRLSAECMVYREICESLPRDFLPVEDRPDSQDYQQRLKPLVSSHFDGTLVTLKKKGGNKEVYIAPGGLVKRTFTIATYTQSGIREYRVIGYLSLDDWLSGSLVSPYEHPLIGPLIYNIDQDLLQKSCFKRCPPRICSIPVTGRLYYAGESNLDPDSSSAATSAVWPAPTAPDLAHTSYTISPNYPPFTPSTVNQTTLFPVQPTGYLSTYSAQPTYQYQPPQQYQDHHHQLPSVSTSGSWNGANGIQGNYHLRFGPIRTDSFVSDITSGLSSYSLDSPAWTSGNETPAPKASFMSSPYSYPSAIPSPSPYGVVGSLPFTFDHVGQIDVASASATTSYNEALSYYQTAGISPALISPSSTAGQVLSGTTYFPVVKTEYDGV